MKIKLQYIIIAILVATNIYFIIDGKIKSFESDNSEFKREMNYLEKRINFDENQLELAKKEYDRYSSNKKKIERKFRKYDLVIMDDITNETISNSNNMDKYYEIAVELNTERMLHWKKYREIANEEQIKKLDSIWKRMKDRIRSSN
tara:strand:- start:658 stop:1095 length:438 start_codon:yes stop_codon:yes gene_type:complete